MASKWNMIVDVEHCDNCRGCFLAVKDEHAGNISGLAAQPAQGQRLNIRRERGLPSHFVPVMCNHCDDAPCMKRRRTAPSANGPIVIIDAEK